MVIFASCNSNSEKPNKESETVNTETSNLGGEEKLGSEETENITMTIKHELGEVEIQKNPEKVIVFDYATLDSLDAMGVEIIGLPKSNIPAFLEKFADTQYADVGTLFEPNFEKIYELKPDVIFISGRQAEVYEELAKIAPTIYLTVDGADYMNQFMENVSLLGEIFGKEEFVANELAELTGEIQKLKEAVMATGENALVVMANDGSISAHGDKSRFAIIHGDFGFPPVDPNIEVSKHGQSISFEYIVEKNPDYLFVVDRAAIAGGSVSAEQIFDNELMKQTKVYQEDRIIYLNSQVWYVASGGLTGTKIMIEDMKIK